MYIMQEDSHFTITRSADKSAASDPRSIFGIRLAALIEMVLFFSVAMMVDLGLGDGSRFFDVSPHPFWIIVLLITVQYGAKEALVCALLSSAVLLVDNLPPQEVTETIYDYMLKIMVIPFLWISAATILGGIRTRQLSERSGLRDNIAHTDEQAKTITQAYKRLMQQKENLERRLAEELHSSVTVYRAAKSLETIDRRDVAVAIKNIMLTTMNPDKFSLFELDQHRLTAQLCHGWDKDEPHSRSFAQESSLFQAIAVQKKIVCIVNHEDEHLLAGEGMIAGPIIDAATNEVFGMLKIETHGVMGLSMRNIETFRILCEWVGMVYVNAKRYQRALDDGMIQVDSKLLSPKLLKYQETFLSGFAGRLGFNLFRVNVTMVNAHEFSDSEHVAIASKAGDIIRTCIRRTDQLFRGNGKEELVVIAICFRPHDIENIIEKIQMGLITHSNELLRRINFSFDVKQLHVKSTFKEASDVKTAS